MVAGATEQCRVWPKTAAQDVMRVWAHCRGAGSSRHPAIFPVVFGEMIHVNVVRPPGRTRGVRYPRNQKTPVT